MTDAVPPPQNIDAEEYVLGAMMLSARAIESAVGELDAGDFYRESHARIYRAALSLHQLGRPVDAITVCDRLEELGQLGGAAGATRVREIAALVPASSNVAHHARIVARLARLRHAAAVAATIQRRAHEAADPAELEQEIRQLADTIAAPTQATAPKVVTLDEFLASDEEPAQAAIGSPGETLLPIAGLLILGGEGGAAKTTLTIDAVAHAASGTTWLGYPVARPIRVLIIENEGPRPQFRAKLDQKTSSWAGAPFTHNVHIWEEPWAQFSFARERDRRHLQQLAQDRLVDVVVADPLDSLGIPGAGSPEDTRQFIAWLRECGLHNPNAPLAFWLLHHFAKAPQRSVVQQLSGAWGAHPDAIIGLEPGDGQTTKLTWGKLRHATPPADKTIILAWDTATRGFAPIDKPPPVDLTELRDRILAHVTNNPGEAQSAIEDAIGGGRKTTRDALLWLASDKGGNLLATGPGRAKNGKYFYPSNHAALRSPDPLFGERGEHTPQANGEAPLASPPALPKGGGLGEQTERPALVTVPSNDDLDALFGATEAEDRGTTEKKGAP